MTLDETYMTPIREHAKLLIMGNPALSINGYLPCDTGDKKFAHIAKDYTGGGTTCGFLCHWLLWRLGCTDTTIINRAEPMGNFTYKDGQNISRIWHNGKLPFVNVSNTDWVGKKTPKPGDIVFIKQANGPNTTEHVFVFLEEFTENGKIFWRTAEAGQKNQNNQECARIKQRELKPKKPSKGATLSGNNPERDVFGWLSLAELTYNTQYPIPPIPPIAPPPFDPILNSP